MAADASSALGAPQIAGAWVNRKGKGKRTMGAVAGAQIGGVVGAAVGAGLRGKGSPQPSTETPEFGGFGFLAVSETDLVLVKGKQGLMGLKMTDEVVGKVPRSDVASIEIGPGRLVSPLTITFGNGGQWEVEVARASKGAAERVVAELSG